MGAARKRVLRRCRVRGCCRGSCRGGELDALLVDIAAAITANRTLGGAVEWAQPGSASFEDVEFEGAAAARAAAIPVTLWFTIAGSPLA